MLKKFGIKYFKNTEITRNRLIRLILIFFFCETKILEKIRGKCDIDVPVWNILWYKNYSKVNMTQMYQFEIFCDTKINLK